MERVETVTISYYNQEGDRVNYDRELTFSQIADLLSHFDEMADENG